VNPVFLNNQEEEKKQAGWRECATQLSSLKFDREREIQLPRGSAQGHTVDGARAAPDGAINASVCRICRVDDVEDIECIHAEFDRQALADGEGLHQRQISIEKTGAGKGVSRRRASLVEAWARKSTTEPRRNEVGP